MIYFKEPEEKRGRRDNGNFELRWVLSLATIMVVAGAIGYLLEISGGTALAVAGAALVRGSVNKQQKKENKKDDSKK